MGNVKTVLLRIMFNILLFHAYIQDYRLYSGSLIYLSKSVNRLPIVNTYNLEKITTSTSDIPLD